MTNETKSQSIAPPLSDPPSPEGITPLEAADELLDVLKRFAAFPFAHQGVAEGPLAVMLEQAQAAIAKAEAHLAELEQAQATPIQAQEKKEERWVIDNIYTIARRELRRSPDRQRPEMWGHVQRLCERVGAQSRTVGVLREAGAESTAALTNSESTLTTLRQALQELVMDANRLCDRQLGGTYEDDCRRSIAKAKKALTSSGTEQP